MSITSSSFRHQYHQTLVYGLMMCNRDWYPQDFGGVAKPSDFREPVGIMVLTCEQALEKIRRVDAVTLGIPKIVYMVGWQKGGHDAQYPAWGPVEPRIKRREDITALESFEWLHREAKKYHTTVSVHINMIDAHPFSPLWDLYYKNDIIAKNKDGSLRSYVWGYPISYTREWELGFAQRRIDQLCDLLPVQDAGTVRIDAFHSIVPLLEDTSCISPYLGISSRQEAETQKKIISYFRTKGVDVTGEFSTRFRVDPLTGMQPMSTHYTDIDILKVPASLYCGGDGGDPRVGFNMNGKAMRKFIMESVDMADFVGEFAKSTLIWYYLNRLERLEIDSGGAVVFEGGVRSWVEDTEDIRQADEFAPEQLPGRYYVKKGDDFLRDAGDVFVPALWTDKTIIAHSDDGYKNRAWRLPEDWPKNGQAKICAITVDGLTQNGVADIKEGTVSLTLSPDQSVAVIL